MSVLGTVSRRFVTFFFVCLFTSVKNILHKRFYNMFSYNPQSFLSKTVSALRNHVQEKLHNYTGLNLKVKFNMLSEQGFPPKICKLSFIKQVALVT